MELNEWQVKYEQLVKNYNGLVKEHNTLVDKHEQMEKDARCLLKFVEDLTKGMKMYVRGGLQIGSIDPCEHVSVPANHTLHEGKLFVSALHNEIADFLRNIKVGHFICDAYSIWIARCNKAKENKGGNLL